MVELTFIPYIILVAAAAIIFRIPFLKLPIDEDFAFNTYRANFASKGIKWKKDVFTFPLQWKMHILDTLYGNDGTNGIFRIRLLLTLFHAVSSVLISYGVLIFTDNGFAAVVGGLLYAFFGTVPALYSHSFNYEQLYLPVLLLTFYLLINGNTIAAGMLLAICCILKYSCVVYIPTTILAVALHYGADETVLFIIAGAIPLLLSFTTDLLLGYMDSESLRGLKARFVLVMQLSALKGGIKNIINDFSTVVSRTLPLWIYGLPTLLLSFSSDNGGWIATFAFTTILIFVMQKFFSRYHYIPIIAMLSIATGVAIDYLMNSDSGIASILLIALFIATIDTALRQKTFYLQPISTETLSRYKKFDQFIYLPYLGKILKRLVRMRKEDGRMLIWGNFSQLYHYAGLPASDQFIHYAIGPWDSSIKTVYFDTIIGGIIKHKPIYIIKTFHNLDMKLLEEITGLQYRLLKVALSRFPIYQLESVKNENVDPLSLQWQEKAALMERLCAVGNRSPGIDRTEMFEGKYKRAIKETRKLCRLNRHDLQGKLYLAELLKLNDRKLEAEKVLNVMLEEHPDFPGPRLLLASQKMELEEYEAAKELLEEEIAIHGIGAGTSYHLGLLNLKEKAYKKAIDSFEQALDFSPNNTAFLLTLAESYCKFGLKEKGRAAYDKILEDKGFDDELVRTQAAIEIAKCNTDEMEESETIKSYLASDQENETLKYALASAVEDSDRIMEANRLFEQLTEKAFSDSIRGAAYYRLAAHEEEKEKMKSLLKKCLTLLPSHDAAKEMLIKLENGNIEE